MRIYPNPARSKTFISLPEHFKNGGSLKITNKHGQIIQTKEISENSSNVIPLDMSEHPNGLYTVSMVDDISVICGELLNLSEVRVKN